MKSSYFKPRIRILYINPNTILAGSEVQEGRNLLDNSEEHQIRSTDAIW